MKVMDSEGIEVIASNLTIAFYSGSIQREPYLGEEKRSEPYSPSQRNRIGSISRDEVHSVYTSFCEMLAARKSK